MRSRFFFVSLLVGIVLGASKTEATWHTLDISEYTENASRMTVLPNGDLAVLDNSIESIFLFEPTGSHISTIDISAYVVSPRDITTFPATIGVLDATGIPDAGGADVLKFNTSGSLLETLEGRISNVSPPKEVIAKTSGEYVLYVQESGWNYFGERNADGSAIGLEGVSFPVFGTAALENNNWAYIAERRDGVGDYQIRGSQYVSLWENQWGGDGISPVGTAGFNENHLAVLNDVQTSLLIFNTQDGYIRRIDGLPTSGWSINDIEGDLNSDRVYLLSDSSILVVPKPCLYTLVGDLNDDCKVDLFDFALMALNWLIDCDLTPEDPACIPK